MNWKLELDVNDWVKGKFSELGLVKLKDYNEESGMSPYMKEALKGSAKTKTKANFGKPDFTIEKYKNNGVTIPVIIEDKFKLSKLVSEKKDGIKFDDKSIQAYATMVLCIIQDVSLLAKNIMKSLLLQLQVIILIM